MYNVFLLFMKTGPPRWILFRFTAFKYINIIQILVIAKYACHAKWCGVCVYISGVRFQYFALRFGFGSVVWKTAVSVSVLFFVLFCFQLSASATQRTTNGFLCFNALQRWLSACVTLVVVIRSLNYTFNRDTRHSHDDELICNCVWQCFINIYCLSNQPKKHIFLCECPFQMLWF